MDPEGAVNAILSPYFNLEGTTMALELCWPSKELKSSVPAASPADALMNSFLFMYNKVIENSFNCD